MTKKPANRKAVGKKNWTVYIVECKNKSLYSGITTDLARRMKQHQQGRASRYTKAFGFRRLRWIEPGHHHSGALKREAELKRLTRSSKLALIRKSTLCF